MKRCLAPLLFVLLLFSFAAELSADVAEENTMQEEETAGETFPAVSAPYFSCEREPVTGCRCFALCLKVRLSAEGPLIRLVSAWDTAPEPAPGYWVLFRYSRQEIRCWRYAVKVVEP